MSTNPTLPLTRADAQGRLARTARALDAVLAQARAGALLRDGLTVATAYKAYHMAMNGALPQALARDYGRRAKIVRINALDSEWGEDDARAITEFNYRYADAEQASLFVSVRLTGGDEELGQIIDQLGGNGYPVVNMTESELAKNHVRYMIGGRPARPLGERLYSFKFPEQPGALMRFLETLGCRWNISLFHYRNHGADYGRVLCAFELPDEDVAAFHDYLHEIGYGWKEVSEDPAYRLFLASQGSQ